MSSAPDGDAADGPAPDTATIARVRELLDEHLPGYEPQTIAVVGGDPGGRRVVVDGTLLIELGSGADGAVPPRLSPTVEASLVRALAGLLDVPVPVPVFQQDEPTARAFRTSTGRPLAEHAPEQDLASRLGRRLGGVLADLHGVDASDTGVNLPIAGGPESYRASAARAWAAHSPADRAAVDPVARERVARFLQEPAPDHPPHPSLCHLDLRPATILLDPAGSELAEIRGWSRSAIGDPARDLGAVLLHLGEAPLQAALDGYRRAGAVIDDDPDLQSRIVFHARCAAIEDPDSLAARSPFTD